MILFSGRGWASCAAGFALVVLGLAGPASALVIEPEACALVSSEDVGRIVGSPVAIVSRKTAVAEGGAVASRCDFAQNDAGATARVGLRTFETPAAAQAAFETLSAGRVAMHGTIDRDSVGGIAATIITMPNTEGMIMVVRGRQIVDADVRGAVATRPRFRRGEAKAVLTLALERLATYVK